MSQDVTLSWFATLNNPADHGYPGSPQEVCEQLRDEWIQDSTTRTGAWAYRIASCAHGSGGCCCHAVFHG